MRKVSLIFGHPKNIVIKKLKLFDEIEKNLGTTIIQISKFRYVFNYQNILFEIRFCYNPKKDASYLDSKKYIKQNFDDDVPESARDLIKRIKTKFIIFFGICGSTKTNSNVGDVFIPISTRRLYFKGKVITKREILSLKPSNIIKINNILKNRISGKTANDLTTNITAFSDNLRDVTLEEYENRIRSYADIVQKELYEIVRGIKNKKVSFGAILICSDTPKEKLKPKHNFKFKEKYSETLIETIKLVANSRNSSEANASSPRKVQVC